MVLIRMCQKTKNFRISRISLFTLYRCIKKHRSSPNIIKSMSQKLSDEPKSTNTKKKSHFDHLYGIHKPIINPFENESISQMPLWWKIVQCSIGLTLFPIRFVLLIFVLIPMTLLFLIPFCSCFDACCSTKLKKSVSIAISEESKTDDPTDIESGNMNDVNDDSEAISSQPHSGCRRLAVYPIRLMARCTLWCFGFWWISVDKLKGCAQNQAERPVVVSNHTSLLDAMAMTWYFAPMSVAMLGVKNIPIAGQIAKALQTIFVNRRDPQSKKNTLVEIQNRTSNSKFPSLM